jgi:hypothetical protein
VPPTYRHHLQKSSRSTASFYPGTSGQIEVDSWRWPSCPASSPSTQHLQWSHWYSEFKGQIVYRPSLVMGERIRYDAPKKMRQGIGDRGQAERRVLLQIIATVDSHGPFESPLSASSGSKCMPCLLIVPRLQLAVRPQPALHVVFSFTFAKQALRVAITFLPTRLFVLSFLLRPLPFSCYVLTHKETQSS